MQVSAVPCQRELTISDERQLRVQRAGLVFHLTGSSCHCKLRYLRPAAASAIATAVTAAASCSVFVEKRESTLCRSAP